MKAQNRRSNHKLWKDSLVLKILLSLLLFVIFSCQGLLEVIAVQSTDELAKEQKYRYIANHAIREGMPKKALRPMKKILTHAQDPDQFLNTIARLYQEANEPAQALRFLQDWRKNSPEMTQHKMAQFLNWEGGFALSQQQPKPALESFEVALTLLARHNIHDDLLKASLENNRGVAELFDQGFTSSFDTALVGGNLKVHINDIHRAKAFFERSLLADPTGTVANHNLALMTKILELPSQIRVKSKGYIPNSFIEQINLNPEDLQAATKSLDSNTSNQGKHSWPEKYNEMFTLLEDKNEIVFVLDISGSMRANISKGSIVTRFESMVESVKTLVEWLPKDKKIGLLTVGGRCGEGPSVKLPVDHHNRQAIFKILKKLRPTGGTPLYDRLVSSRTLFSIEENKKTIFLASDGLESCQGNLSLCKLATQLCQQGIDVTVLSLLLDRRSSFRAQGTYQCLTIPCGGTLFGITDAESIESKTNLLQSEYYSFKVSKQDLKDGLFSPISGATAPSSSRKEIVE